MLGSIPVLDVPLPPKLADLLEVPGDLRLVDS